MSIEMETDPNTSKSACQVAVGAQSNYLILLIWPVFQPTAFSRMPTRSSGFSLLVTEYYKLDVLSNFWDVYNIEAEALGQTVVYHPGRDTRYGSHPTTDWDTLGSGSPFTSGPIPVRSNALGPEDQQELPGDGRQARTCLFYRSIQPGR